MKRTGLFPGSFDPFTKGHEAVVRKALLIFDEVIIGIGVNSTKSYLFDLEKRKAHIRSLFPDDPRVRIETYSTLTVNFCKEVPREKVNDVIFGYTLANDVTARDLQKKDGQEYPQFYNMKLGKAKANYVDANTMTREVLICQFLPGLYYYRLEYLLDFPLAAIVTFSYFCLTWWCSLSPRRKRARHGR